MSNRLNQLYDVQDVIGKGASGCVHGAIRKSDQKSVAIKMLHRLRVPDSRMAIDPKLKHRTVPMEVYILSRVHHKNIIKLLDYFENDDTFYIVTERVRSKFECQDLFEFIDKQNPLSEETVVKIVKQIVQAMVYLQSKNVYHLDVKDENFVIDEQLNVKLIDFGSAHIVKSKDQWFERFYGTLDFASPSILLGRSYQPAKSEVWSLGTLLWTLIYGQNPYDTVNNNMKGVRSSTGQRHDISQELSQLVEQMLDRDGKSRPSIEQISLSIKAL